MTPRTPHLLSGPLLNGQPRKADVFGHTYLHCELDAIGDVKFPPKPDLHFKTYAIIGVSNIHTL